MQILKIPNPILTTKAQDVTDFNTAGILAADMITTAQKAGLVGLAASQISILQRIFVVNFSLMGENSYDNFKVFINPVIKVNQKAGKNFAWESCGSIPKLSALVERHNEISIHAKNEMGIDFEIGAKGIIARICLHEQDHLFGILITSKARQIKRG
jgi:peptide deformylase